MLLQSLDAVIAFTTVMLVLSLMITALVQLVISVCGLRGRNVLWGLEQLFQRTLPPDDRQAPEIRAGELAQKVLSHDVLSTSTNWLLRILERATGGRWNLNGGNRPPAALHLNDVKLVLGDLGGDRKLADDVLGLRQAAAEAGLDPELAKELAATLRARFPEQEDAVRDALEEIESKTRQTAEQAKAAAERLEDWFELTMDAAAERLKLRSRWITVFFALVLAFGMRVDSIDIMHQLFDNPELAAQVLAQAAEVQATAAEIEAATGGNGREAIEELDQTVTELKATLQQTGLDVFRPFDSWADGWCYYFGPDRSPDDAAPESRSSLLGLLATVLLLSLGGPFWSGALSKLLGFRAILRKRRQQEAAAADGRGG